MPSEQRILLFESQPAGILTSKREDNLAEIQAMLDQGWKVVSMSPTSRGRGRTVPGENRDVARS
jgi:hypothetical protein